MSAAATLVEAPSPAARPLDRVAPRSPALDLFVGVVGLWLAAGFLLDSWAHLHVAVETFFTPYHAVFYSAMAAGAIGVAIAASRNRALGFTGWNAVPAAYQAALWGIPIFFAGGVGDLIWHSFFGIEDRVEAVTSPTHLIIGLGVILVMGGPIRSALAARGELRTLRAQLPLIFALATWLEFVHLGTAYAFDPGAAQMYAPPDGTAYGPDYFTNATLLLFKTGSGVAIVILQALVLMGFTVWLVSRFALRPGALTLLFVLGNGMIAAALTNDTPILFTYLTMSVVAGVVGDILVARLGVVPGRSMPLRIFGFLVPGAYFGTYFLVTALTGGVWWSWNLILGAVVWSMLCGAGLTLLAGGRSAEPASAG